VLNQVQLAQVMDVMACLAVAFAAIHREIPGIRNGPTSIAKRPVASQRSTAQ
jgi:hypothetical protein